MLLAIYKAMDRPAARFGRLRDKDEEAKAKNRAMSSQPHLHSETNKSQLKLYVREQISAGLLRSGAPQQTFI